MIIFWNQKIRSTYLNKDKIFLFYLKYQVQTIRQDERIIEDEQAKAYNKAIKYINIMIQ